MTRSIRWWIFFLLLFFAGDRLGGWWLQRQVDRSQFRYSRLYGGSAGADLLLLGNSRGLTFYQPYIEEISGRSTCNLSYNGLPADLAKVLAEDYLDRYPAPELLLIDITTCDRENDALLSGFMSYQPRSMRLDTLLRHKLPKVWWGGKLSELYRFNNEVAQRALYHRNSSDKDWLLDRNIPAGLIADMANQPNYSLRVHPYLVLQIQELVAYAQARGVKVKLVISPYFPGFSKKVEELDALKTAVEQATGLKVLDYRDVLQEAADFGDFQHPNIKGSKHYIDLMQRDSVF